MGSDGHSDRPLGRGRLRRAQAKLDEASEALGEDISRFLRPHLSRMEARLVEEEQERSSPSRRSDPLHERSSPGDLAEPQDHGPLTVLVQLQAKCWQRWQQNTMLFELSREEWEAKCRAARLLVAIRDATRSTMAMHFRVWRLLHSAFEAFVINVDGDEASAQAALAAGDQREKRRRLPPSPTRAGVRGNRGQPRGMRGMSKAEVRRKAWWRWRFATAVESTWSHDPPKEARRTTVTHDTLSSIAQEVRDTRRHLGASLGYSGLACGMDMPGDTSEFGLGVSQMSAPLHESGNRGTSRPSSQSQLASPTRSQTLHESSGSSTAKKEEHPPHLALLQKALASFDRLSSKTPPRQRLSASASVEPRGNGFGFSVDSHGQRAVPSSEPSGKLGPEAMANSTGPKSLWSPGLPAAPAVEPEITSGRGALSLGTSTSLESPRQTEDELPAGRVAGNATNSGGIGEDLVRSPNSLRRASRLKGRRAMPNLWGPNRQPTNSPADEASAQIPATMEKDNGDGSPVDLTQRMSRTASAPSLEPSWRHRGTSDASGGSQSLRGAHTRVLQSPANSLRARNTEEARGTAHLLGHENELSFHLDDHGGNVPAPLEPQDYQAIKRRIAGRDKPANSWQ